MITYRKLEIVCVCMCVCVSVCVCVCVCVDILPALIELHFVRQFLFPGVIQWSLKMGSCADYSYRVMPCLPLVGVLTWGNTNTCVCATHKNQGTMLCL